MFFAKSFWVPRQKKVDGNLYMTESPQTVAQLINSNLPAILQQKSNVCDFGRKVKKLTLGPYLSPMLEYKSFSHGAPITSIISHTISRAEDQWICAKATDGFLLNKILTWGICKCDDGVNERQRRSPPRVPKTFEGICLLFSCLQTLIPSPYISGGKKPRQTPFHPPATHQKRWKSRKSRG